MFILGFSVDADAFNLNTFILILEVDSIELNFDSQKILFGVYLKAEKGKVTAILGRNGCGKTSLLRIIFGDLNPKYKNIRINGQFQKKALFKQNKIAYLTQHQLLPKSTKIASVFKHFDANWEDFVSIFNSFEPYHQFRVNTISSGELRVIEAYLILSSKKSVILLDEPFSFIAPIYIEKIKRLIQEKKKQSAVLITDHYYRDVLELSDSIYLLKNGYSKLIRSKTDLKNEGYLNSD